MGSPCSLKASGIYERGVAVKNESSDLLMNKLSNNIIKHYGKRSTSILIFIDIKFLEHGPNSGRAKGVSVLLSNFRTSVLMNIYVVVVSMLWANHNYLLGNNGIRSLVTSPRLLYIGKM